MKYYWNTPKTPSDIIDINFVSIKILKKKPNTLLLIIFIVINHIGIILFKL